MNDIQMAHFSWGETPDRSRIHEVALRDARITSEARGSVAAGPRPSIVERLGLDLGRIRLALAFGPAAASEPCACDA